jgi:hypothetical protein
VACREARGWRCWRRAGGPSELERGRKKWLDIQRAPGIHRMRRENKNRDDPKKIMPREVIRRIREKKNY